MPATTETVPLPALRRRKTRVPIVTTGDRGVTYGPWVFVFDLGKPTLVRIHYFAEVSLQDLAVAIAAARNAPTAKTSITIGTTGWGLYASTIRDVNGGGKVQRPAG